MEKVKQNRMSDLEVAIHRLEEKTKQLTTGNVAHQRGNMLIMIDYIKELIPRRESAGKQKVTK